MQIDIGQDVYSSDKQKVGHVQRFLVDPDTREVEQLVIRLNDSDQAEHKIDRDKVTGETTKGLNLAMSQAELNRLPPYVATDFVESLPEDVTAPANPQDVSLEKTTPLATGTPGTHKTGTTIFPGGPSAAAQGVPSADRETLQTVDAKPPMGTGKPQRDVLLSNGTDITSSDDETLGNVVGIVSDQAGRLSAVVLHDSRWMHHLNRIPIGWIDDMNSADVSLNLTANEVAARIQAAGESSETLTSM